MGVTPTPFKVSHRHRLGVSPTPSVSDFQQIFSVETSVFFIESAADKNITDKQNVYCRKCCLIDNKVALILKSDRNTHNAPLKFCSLDLVFFLAHFVLFKERIVDISADNDMV